MTAPAIAVVVVLAGCSGAVGTSSDGDGPLEAPPRHGSTWRVAPGDSFTDGLEVIRLPPGVSEVRLDAVRLDASACMKVLGAKIAGPRRRYASVQFLDSWPPTEAELGDSFVTADVRDASGAVLNADDDPHQEGWELLVGIRSDCPTESTRRSILLDYTVDGTSFTLSIPAELVLSSPTASP